MDVRKEIKFCLNFDDVFKIKKILNPFITPDKHCNMHGYYFINSKYIGNVKSCNISGKFRLRTYDDAKFLEFKYKENDLRKKIRVKIENLDIYELLVKVDNSSDFIKILKKINFPIIPNEQSMKFKYVEIDYIREAFECIYDDNIARITFDYNIISSGQIINKDTCIFEIKGENFKKIEELLRCIIKDKETKFSKYKIAKKQCGTYHNPFYDLLENMSKSKFFYNYMKYNMNYYLIEKTKEYNELYKKIQFLLYRQIYLKQLFYDILHNIPIESKKYMIGIKGYFIEQYYDVPRLYGDIDFIAIQGKAYDVIKTFIDMGYSVKKYKYTPFYNNYVFLKILKDEYLKILHSFELQKSFSICNENINIEIDLQNKIYPTEKNFNKKTTIEKYRYNCGFLELDFLDYFLYLVNHIMQHLLFITPSEKNLQINLQKLYDLYIIVEKNTSKYNEKKLILAAKSKKMIPHLLYVLNIYTKVFYNSNVKFNIDNILLHYNRNQCEWANILDVSFDMDVSDIILGDFSKTKMYKLNEFLDLNSSIKNQSLYEFKCRILLNKLNKKGLI